MPFFNADEIYELPAALAQVTHVTDLQLGGTRVRDILALMGHPSLRLVEIQRTKVEDLRPALLWLAMQPYMSEDPDNGGLRFGYSAAAESDPRLAAMTKGQPVAHLKKLAAFYNVAWPINVAEAN